MNKKWEYYNSDKLKIKQISQKFNLPEFIAKILVNRNITEDEQIKVFLNPTRNDFYNPFLLNDMDKAVSKIIEAINKKQKIIIYGDYDVDGITSITVLKKFLEDRGIKAGYYIPDRLNEGYGLNKEAISKISSEGYELIITVDCGITAIEDVEYANSLGMKVIVTDHHEPSDIIPNAFAVINPKRQDSTYPFKNLAGVGVVFKLIQAISKKLELPEKEYLKYLDLVCIGTISDIVPLIDENRVIAKLGLKLVCVTRNIGLRELISSIRLKKIDSSAVSFGIAPRINACGRMGHADEAVKLFLTQNIVEAGNIADDLNKYNVTRQSIEKKIYEEALIKIEENNMSKENSIILGGENWHHGVIGIVASKITDLFNKPSILICFEGDEGKGSGRSIMGFDLHNALCKSSEYLEKFGGHEMAVGLSLKKENFNKFKEKFQGIVEESDIKDIVPIIKIDEEIDLKNITMDMVKEMSKLEPFGEENKIPIFLFRNLKIDSIRAISDGKHLKLSLKYSRGWIDAIGFNMGELVEQFTIEDKIDVVGFLEINSYNNIEKLQINIKDMMKSIV